MTEQFGYKICFYLLCITCFVLVNAIIVIKKRNKRSIDYLQNEIKQIAKVKYSYEKDILKLNQEMILVDIK